MEWFELALSVGLGFALRFAMPLLITAGVIVWLRWLDSRWQTEADEYITRTGLQPVPAASVACWDEKGCSPEKRAACPAYQNNQVPCWQLFRDSDGWLQQDCLGCDVFRQAALPIPA